MEVERFTAESIKKNREQVTLLFNDMCGKFLTKQFRVADLVKFYNYTEENADALIVTLAQNGMLTQQQASGVMFYYLHTDKEIQIKNLQVYKDMVEEQLRMYNMMQTRIRLEIQEDKKTWDLQVEK